jgi:hypothetical protein
MEKIKQLEQRIVELETKNRLILDAMLNLVDLIDIEHKNFALLALTCGFSSEELNKIEETISWAIHNFNNITRNDFIRKFEENLPYHKEMLISILEAYKAEGLFMPICRLVLDNEL